MQPVIDLFYEHYGAFGRRTLKVLLARQGIHYSEWKIARMMKLNGLVSKHAKRRIHNVHLSKNTKKYIKDNIYETLSDEDKKKEIWTTDFTEEMIDGRKVFTCAIKSINHKVIVGFKMSKRATSSMAIEALNEAVERFGVPYMIHTDRGPQFISKAYHDTIERLGIEHSMSRPYHAVENCFIETLWHTFKTEIGPVDHLSIEEYEMVMHYFYHYYNHHRPHSALDYKPPLKKLFESNEYL